MSKKGTYKFIITDYGIYYNRCRPVTLQGKPFFRVMDSLKEVYPAYCVHDTLTDVQKDRFVRQYNEYYKKLAQRHTIIHPEDEFLFQEYTYDEILKSIRDEN